MERWSAAGQDEARTAGAPAGGRGRSRRVSVFAVLIVVAVAAIGLKLGPDTLSQVRDGAIAASGRLMAGEGHSAPVPVPSSQPVGAQGLSPAAYDHLALMPPDLRAALVAAEPSGSQPFRFLVAVPPARICAAMASEGLANPGWAAMGEEWQCASDLVPVAGSVPVAPDPELLAEGMDPGDVEARPSTLYFVARGPAEDRLGQIRFKLNLDDPSVDRAGREALLSALKRLSGPLAWSMPDTVEQAVLRHRKLSAYDRGIGVEVHPESGAIRRLNVVLLLDTPSARLPTDRFEQLPRGILETLAQ